MYPYQDKTLSPELRAEDLVSRMELREKVGQLTQRLYGWQAFEKNGEELTLSDVYKDEVDRYSGLGTLYGLHRADPWSGKDFETGLTGTLSTRAANMIQKYAIEHSRFGIPVLLSSECPHGHQALDGFLLPVNLAAGCSFDPDLFEEAAKVSGQQLKAMGIHLALVSALDILRDPRWGRSEECFGEDPYLASRMAQAVVRGIQSQGVDVTAKHMCAQGETTGGVNASAARIGQRELREIHLPPVKACVEAGVSSFMAAYNEIDGVYCHGNHWLLTDLLRGEYMRTLPFPGRFPVVQPPLQDKPEAFQTRKSDLTEEKETWALPAQLPPSNYLFFSYLPTFPLNNFINRKFTPQK